MPFLDIKDRKLQVYDKDKKDEKETNLDHVGEELLKVVEMQVGSRELGLDEIPDPLEEGPVRDVGCIRSFVGTSCEQGNELADGGDDKGSRVTAL